MARFTVLPLSVLVFFLLLSTESSWAKSKESKKEPEVNDVALPSCCGFSTPLLIKKDQWKPILATKFGQISTVQIGDGCGGLGPYTIHSITLEPNALLLPILLHADMVFFVDSGSGIMNWVEEKATSSEIRRGDVYRLRPGSVFYLQSKPVDIFLGTKLRVYAIFSNTEECLHDPCFGAYSSITDLLFGFDETILQSAFGVPEGIIGMMRNRTQPPLIVNDMLTTPANTWQFPSRLLKLLTGDDNTATVIESAENKKKKEKKEKKEKKPKSKKAKMFNLFESTPDFESPNGRTITINTKDLKVLTGSTVGVFMVNLTQGSMMGPHWNPWACEISIALRGSGMVRVLRSSITNSSGPECENARFRVEEGDIFAVPRLHPMAQMSFSNDSFVFVGFTTSSKNNEPQFLAGRSSALRMLDREVLGASLNVSTVVVDGLLGAQKEAVMLGCPFCAEEEFKKLEQEKEKKPQWPPQPQPQPEPQPKPEPQPQPQPQPKPQPEPEPQPQPEPEPQPQKPQPHHEPQPQKPQPHPEPQPQKPQPHPEPEPQLEPEPQPQKPPQPFQPKPPQEGPQEPREQL